MRRILQGCVPMKFQVHLFLIVLAASLLTVRGEDWNFVARINQGLSQIVPDDAHVEKVSGGFGFLEGPGLDSQGRISSLQRYPRQCNLQVQPL